MSENFKLALKWTLAWVLLLALLLLLGGYHDPKDSSAFFISDSTWTKIVSWGALVMVVLAFYGVRRASSFIPPQKYNPEKVWHSDGTLIALVIFWILFPPSFFFVEYYLSAQQFIRRPDEAVKLADYLKLTKDFSDLAGKVWAGTSALLAALLAIAKR